jgi:chitin synthase
VPNLAHSYNQAPAMPPSRTAHRQSVGLYPEDHRDNYSEPYQPHPRDDSYPLTQYNTGPQDYDDDDRRPILDPHSNLNTPLVGPEGDPYLPRGTPSPVRSTPTPGPGGLRRWNTVKQVELYKGNLVLDCPIPKKLLEMLPEKKEREFTHMR